VANALKVFSGGLVARRSGVSLVPTIEPEADALPALRCGLDLPPTKRSMRPTREPVTDMVLPAARTTAWPFHRALACTTVAFGRIRLRHVAGRGLSSRLPTPARR
jgi:hypothetical protein